jgi:hypothetical protein
VIQKFAAGVTAVRVRAGDILNFFAEILLHYGKSSDGLRQVCSSSLTEIDRLLSQVNAHAPYRAGAQGLAGEFVMEAESEMNAIACSLSSAVNGTVSAIQQSIQTQLAAASTSIGSNRCAFPVITSANNLPDAHTAPPTVTWRNHHPS